MSLSRARPTSSCEREALRPRAAPASVTVDSAVSGEGSSEPTISSASWRLVVLCRLGLADGGAAPHHGDVVGDREHLVELVGDEQDRVALGLELAQVVEERVDLLRHQHRGRLVEDDDLGAAVEHLEDLDPLPLADAEVLDQLVGVEAEAVGLGDLDGSSSRASSPMPCSFSAPRTTFSRTVRLSASMKCWKTMPMPCGDGVGRRGEGDLLAVDGRSCPRRASARRRGSSSASTCRRRSRRPARARCRARIVMSTSWLAITPGNRLPIPRTWTASAGSGAAAVALIALPRSRGDASAVPTGTDPGSRYRVAPGPSSMISL